MTIGDDATMGDDASSAGPVPADLAFGAFSSDPPWVLELDRLSWDAGIDGLRARTRAEAPRLTRRRRLPPGSRVVRVGVLLGTALAAWYVVSVRRLAARGRAWPRWRTVSFLSGTVLVIIAVQSGLASYDDEVFWIHVIQHLLLMNFAPILLALSAPR